MSDESSQENPLDRLADAFVARFRRGERPALSEYCALHPELADDIRRVFPTLVVMEQARPAGSDSGSSGTGTVAGMKLERLGDYRILREIARGGMGIVYEAEQESLGRHVALKVLPPQALLDPRHLQRFQREARAAARLHHTNIVPVFGVGEHDGLYYYVMQFIHGLGLDQVLDELRRLRWSHLPEAQPSKNEDHSLAVRATVADAQHEDRMEFSHAADGLDRRKNDSQSRAASPSAAQIAESLISGGQLAGVQSASPLPRAERANSAADLRLAEESPIRLQPRQSEDSDSATFHVRSPSSDGSGSGINLLARDTTALSHPGLQYWQSVARIGVQVAEALDYSFGQGVLHRDIKPSNLLLDTHGTVWVTDFGLAKASDNDDLTQTGDIVGTLRYLAPERLRGEVDLRGDIYSLGVTLYEMLALRPPFQDRDRSQLVRRILEEEPPRPRAIEPAIPHDLETIVLKAIAKDSPDRYQTAGELASDLRRFLEDKPIAARRVGPSERLWRLCRRNPVVAGLTAAVAVLLVSALVILSISNARIRRETREKEFALRVARENEVLVGRTAAEREEQRRIAVDRLYASQMNLAGQAFEHGQLARVLDLLESQQPQPGEPDLRGFEWHYLWREIHRPLHVSFRQPEDEVWCLAFSPDGNTLAVGSKSRNQGAVRFWDVQTGKLQGELTDDGQDVVSGLEFSPDGKYLATGSADAKLRIWDVGARRVIANKDTIEVVRSVRWSRAGGLIAAGCQMGSVKIFDATSFDLKETISTVEAPVLGLAFSADGKRLVSSVAWGGPKKHRTLIHDLTTSPPQLLHPPRDGFFATDVSPVDEMVASYEPGLIHVWDPATLSDRIRITAAAGWLNSVRFSPDGRRIATGGFDDRLATVWDCDTGQPVMRGPHAQAVQVVAFDPNRRFWASASIDGEVKIWHYDEPDDRTIIKHDPPIHRMFVSSMDDTLILGGNFEAEACDVETGEPRSVPTVRHLRAISANGRAMAVAVPGANKEVPETIQIWDRRSGELRMSWKLPDSSPLFYENIAMSPTGRLLATLSVNMPLRVWDVSGNEPRPLRDFAPVESMCLAFSPDERLLVAGCMFGRVRLWDLETGDALSDLQAYESGSGWALSVGFSPDGKRVAAGNSSGVVRVWDLHTLRLVTTLKGHLGEISDLTFLPDSRRLAVASVGSIRLWDAEVGMELISLNTHNDKIRFLAVTPDGRNLISRDDHEVVRIWKSRLRRP